MNMKRFNEIIDQDRARARLQGDLASGTIKHAYLLTGRAGTGRTTLALAFAQGVLCEARGDADAACGDCASCRLVRSENHPDLIRMAPEDGKPYRIEAVRDLQRMLSYRPIRGAHRVILMEQAERLGETAGNALLKIIEEPPAGTVFVLVAVSPDAMLETIVSRCQHIACGALSEAGVARLLQREHGLDEQRARSLARRAQGSLSDASPDALPPEDTPWLIFDSVEAMLRDEPARLFDLAAELESQDKLSAIVSGWRRALRDRLVEGLETGEGDPDRLIEAIGAMGETLRALDARANKRLALEALMLALNKSFIKRKDS